MHFRLALPLRLESIEDIDNIDHFPKPICYACGHCGVTLKFGAAERNCKTSDATRLDRRGFRLLSECVGQPCEPAHVHPHRQIVALGV